LEPVGSKVSKASKASKLLTLLTLLTLTRIHPVAKNPQQGMRVPWCAKHARLRGLVFLQSEVRGTAVAQRPQYEFERSDCGADQIERVNICKASRSFEV
jgi:hypothetical protein